MPSPRHLGGWRGRDCNCVNCLEPASVGHDPIVYRVTEKTTEHGYVEERNLPPQSRHAQHDVTISLETRQRPTVGQNEIERLQHFFVADDRRRVGAEVAYLDLPETVESQEPRHGPLAEAAGSVVDHLHSADFSLPRRAEGAQPLVAHKTHMSHDHDEREVIQVHQQGELEVEEYGSSKQVRPGSP